MKQNITLSMEKELIQKARILAVQRQTSVSNMLSQELKRMVEKAAQYESAKRKAFACLESGFSLGNAKVNREVLHERKSVR
ncbi:MAG: hypothetical protein JRH15_17330 [Deltaproteobacteria bacterium]|nr:hypothetical protein [Deltaproteobacteria bacterium]